MCHNDSVQNAFGGKDMTLTIELSPKTEEAIRKEARSIGVPVLEYLSKLIEDKANGQVNELKPVIDERNSPAILMLQNWIRDEATDDPEALNEAQLELERFKSHLIANRGDSQIEFPS